MIHFNRGGGGVQCNYPVGSQASKVGQGSFGPTPLKRHSPVLPFKSSDTLFTSATPGGNSSFDHSGWTADGPEREVCPYATFQMPQQHSQQVEHFQVSLRRQLL